MKRVLLMRHAKSSWKHPSPDFKRGLKKRGKSDAKLVADELKSRDMIPQIIISSFAKRAKLTAKIVKSRIDSDIPLILDEALYETGVREYLSVIEDIDERYDSVMVVAHNPTISEVATKLTGNSKLEWMPTSAVAVIECDIDSWHKIATSRCKLLDYITPKMLKGAK